MATAPKSVPKAVPKAAEAPEGEPAPVVKKKSKKKSIVLISIILLVVGIAGAAAWYFIEPDAAQDAPATAEAKPKDEHAKPPVFLVIDPFTVNLQQETGEQFLQVAFSLQVADQAQVELIKLYMPQVRSRLLLLLSGKKASEISSVEGKKKLAQEIIAAVKQPFGPQGEPQAVTDVFFTSFVIQ